MVMRLGFSVATAIDPEVLIIDEILAVGDLYFQKKCIDRIFDFRKAGKSILFCSHSLYDVRQVCDDVVWIKDGRIEEHGAPQDVTVAYANYERALTADPAAVTAGREKQVGELLPVITDMRMLTADGAELEDTIEPGLDVVFEIDFLMRRDDKVVHLGLAIFRNDNVLVFSFLSILKDIPAVIQPGKYRVRFEVPQMGLLEGEYNVVGYLLDETGIHFYDHRQVGPLLVGQEENHPGIVRVPHEITVQKLDGAP